MIIIAKHNSEIIGAITSGIMGTRVTINHIAILENYRKMYIGSNLVRLNYDEIKKRGVKRIFLFVENDDSVARLFWHKAGFTIRVDEITMERDI
ncbi:GNAT family N-acetyltransferase [Psychrobacter pygoscelis]|uniref:GNAT family N-acetyltransferase n=1 Tax=Psychrobacter pygoscelis TaxID=2488563 RepID=UPI0013F3C7A1|nr:GNAT family N-acetyltransferase [Psychrobacter pygoscelis]